MVLTGSALKFCSNSRMITNFKSSSCSLIPKDLDISINKIQDRKDEGFKALKKGMAYCWSVAIVGNPDEGKKMFEKWTSSTDKDINWIIKENLKKQRLNRMDQEWTELWKKKMIKL